MCQCFMYQTGRLSHNMPAWGGSDSTGVGWVTAATSPLALRHPCSPTTSGKDPGGVLLASELSQRISIESLYMSSSRKDNA